MATATFGFEARTVGNAPVQSKELLSVVKRRVGFVPNLLGTLANSPVTLRTYLAIDEAFNGGTFSARERQLILLAASVENQCDYCVPAHSTILKGQLNVDGETVAAIREGRTLPDDKLQALVAVVRAVVRERGNVPSSVVDQFLEAGYREDQLMEVLVGVSLKTISNYLDQLSHIELDEAFAAER